MSESLSTEKEIRHVQPNILMPVFLRPERRSGIIEVQSPEVSESHCFIKLGDYTIAEKNIVV